MPPATIGPGPSMPPPFALTPLTVGNSWFVLNCQMIFPSVDEYARMPPSSEPESTAPGIAVTAAPCDARQVGRVASQSLVCGGTLQTISPVARRRALMPPGVLVRRSETPTYAC